MKIKLLNGLLPLACTVMLFLLAGTDMQGQSRYRRSGNSSNSNNSNNTSTGSSSAVDNKKNQTKKSTTPNSVYRPATRPSTTTKPSTGTSVHNYGSGSTTRKNNNGQQVTSPAGKPGNTGNNGGTGYNNGGTPHNNNNNRGNIHNYNNGGSDHKYGNRPSRPSAGHTPPPPANHRPPKPMPRPHGAPAPRPSVHHYGYYTPTLPYGATVIHRGAYDYYYISGRYYRPLNGVYVICRPPVGSIIASSFLAGTVYLTNYVVRDVYGNIRQRYYTDDDGVYYVKSGRNYIVVDPPVGAIIYELPYGYEEAMINGVKYYKVDDNFYELVYDGGSNYYFRMVGTLGR